MTKTTITITTLALCALAATLWTVFVSTDTGMRFLAACFTPAGFIAVMAVCIALGAVQVAVCMAVRNR